MTFSENRRDDPALAAPGVEDIESGVEPEIEESNAASSPGFEEDESRLIEEIQALTVDEPCNNQAPADLQEDPMIFHPMYYTSEIPPADTPPEPAEFYYPHEMASMPWPGYPYPVHAYNPEMPVVHYPPATWEVPCVPTSSEMSHPNVTYAYPIFQPVPTFVGQPFYHRHVNQPRPAPTGACSTVKECYNCRRPGHLARNCGEVASDKQCFHCLKFGHVVRNCPQTRQHFRREGSDHGDPRMNNSLSSSPTYLEWSSDSGDPASDCNDVRSPCGSSPMPAEFGFNPPDYDVNPANARFYIIKSNSEQDVKASIENGVWCSTDHGNKKIDLAYKNHHLNGPTILLFSVNNSGKFCGIAEMISRVDLNKESGIWSNNRFRGQFRVKWTHVKDVPNSALRHIYLANNDFKPVTFSRDTQEVPPREGKRMLYIMHKYKHLSSMLDPITEKDSEDESGSLNFDENQERENYPYLSPSMPYPTPFAAYPQFFHYPVVPFPSEVAPHPQPYPYPSPAHQIHPAGVPLPLEQHQQQAHQSELPYSPSLELKNLQEEQQQQQPILDPEIVNSLDEFPSLPKKNMTTPLNTCAA